MLGNQWEPGTNTQHAFECYVRRFGSSSRGYINEDVGTRIRSKTWNAGFSGTFRAGPRTNLRANFAYSDTTRDVFSDREQWSAGVGFDYSDFLGGFGLLILDEAHHVAARTFHSVVDRCPARYRLGLTATPEREDGLTALLDLFMGAPLVTVTHDVLVAAGVLTVPDIHSVETDFTYLYTCLLYTSPSPRDRTRSRMPSSA